MHCPDVLIVGAGPAGSIAALMLARAGVRVRLVDRAQFPRDKLCGDTLNPGALAILDALGIGVQIRARALPVSGMIVTGPGGATVAATYPDHLRGAAIRRADLDLLLVAAAIEAGAVLDQGVSARAPIVEDGRVVGAVLASNAVEYPVRARLVIAADGRASRLASALRLSRFAASPRRWAFGAYFANVSGQTTHGEMHIRRDGYIGVAPLPCGVTNVCVVRELRGPAKAGHDDGPAEAGHDDAVASRAGAIIQHDIASGFSQTSADGVTSGFSRTRGDNVASSFSRTIIDAIGGDSLLRDRFVGARQVSPLTALGPLAIDAQAAGCPGLLLAGDAAGFVDPMTGDGLRFALRGGALAAEAALRELGTGQAAWRDLGAARAREFSGKWRVNRMLRTLVGSPRGVDVAARLAQVWSAPVRYLIGVAGDVRLAGGR